MRIKVALLLLTLFFTLQLPQAAHSAEAPVRVLLLDAPPALPAQSVLRQEDFSRAGVTGLTLTPDGLAALRASGVRFQLDHLHRPALAESVLHIGVPTVWSAGWDGGGQTVAVLDSGVDRIHPFLAGKVVAEACFSGGGVLADSICPNGQLSQTGVGAAAPPSFQYTSWDHGTHVAGIVAGGSAGVSGSGVAPAANLFAVQVFSRYLNSSLVAWDSDILRALEAVYDARLTYDIASVNLSLQQGLYPSQAACDADNPAYANVLGRLRAAGIAVVAAAGNSGSRLQIGAPACLTGVVSVAWANDSDVLANETNFTPFVSLIAPGEAIVSSVPMGGMASKRGTSMAAPHVAGAWALLKEAAPDASVEEVLAAMQSSGPRVQGVARIQVDAALEWLTGSVVNPALPLAPADLHLDPRLLAAGAVGARLQFTDTSSNESGFEIERAVGAQGAFVLAERTLQPLDGVGDLTLALPACGVSYRFRVRAYNAVGASDFSNVAEVVADCPPVRPSGLSAVSDVAAQMDLGWVQSEAGQRRFELQFSHNAADWIGLWSGAGVSFQHSGLACGEWMYYRLRAFNNLEQASEWGGSAWSRVRCDLSGPESLWASRNAKGVTLRWDEVSLLETGLRVQRARLGSGLWLDLVDLPPDSVLYLDRAAPCDGLYLYRVWALDGRGGGAVSDTVPAEACPATATPTPTETAAVSETPGVMDTPTPGASETPAASDTPGVSDTPTGTPRPTATGTPGLGLKLRVRLPLVIK